MKKSKLLLMTLLVFILSIALVACGKDDEDKEDKDKDDPKATVSAQAGEDGKDENKDEDKDNKEVTAVTIAQDFVEAFIDMKKIDSISVDAKLALDVTMAGTPVKMSGDVVIEMTKEPVMKMVVNLSANDVDGAMEDMKVEAYAFMEDGKPFMVMNDPTGATEGYQKYNAEDVEGDLATSLADIATSLSEMDMSEVNKDDVLKQVETSFASIEAVVGELKITQEGDNNVIAGKITEEMIDTAVQSLGSAVEGADQYAAMLPEGFGGIDYSLSFNKDTGLFDAMKIDFSALAKALVAEQDGTAGENYIEVGFGFNDVSEIKVPDAELVEVPTADTLE